MTVKTKLLIKGILRDAFLEGFNEVKSEKKSDEINLTDVSYDYEGLGDEGHEKVRALSNLCLSFHKGQHIAILGRNGSGKSTLAKLINGLFLPDKGRVLVFGKDTLDQSEIWSIRQTCGMVFQNPDNQIVGTTVEEDVAFGPENLGLPSYEIRKRVDQALLEVGLEEYALKSPSQLSGGQKQKLAIAGILAMQPSCIILDEATSMLDPKASMDLHKLIKNLQNEFRLTIVDITHDIESAYHADFVYVMKEGQVFFSGTPREVFNQPEKLLAAGLDLPRHLSIFYQLANYISEDLLNRAISDFPQGILTPKEAALAIKKLFKLAQTEQLELSDLQLNDFEDRLRQRRQVKTTEKIVSVKNLSYSYEANSAFAKQALTDLTFDIYKGELLAIIGHSGSGKSTLISHLNALIRPQAGKVDVGPWSSSDGADVRKIRQHVGLLFQYPEHQLFESTVYDDIAFGPRQFKVDSETMEKNIKQAIKIVDLDEKLLTRSPFELSGGQQRRVAMAGILSLDSDIYVLDEPAAGLDPVGKNDIFAYISKLRDLGKTIVLVTHDMNLAADLADRVLVLNEGRIVALGGVDEVFNRSDILSEAGLGEPAAYSFSFLLSELLGKKLTAFRSEQVLFNILKSLQKSADLLGGEDLP